MHLILKCQHKPLYIRLSSELKSRRNTTDNNREDEDMKIQAIQCLKLKNEWQKIKPQKIKMQRLKNNLSKIIIFITSM